MKKGLFKIILLMFITLGMGPVLAKHNLPKTGGRVNLDFQDVDVKDVVNAVAEITGKNFIVGQGVSGKITIVSPSAVSVEEAYDAFLIALQEKNLEAVDQGKFTIIQKRDPISLGRFDSGEEYDSNAEKITRTIKLKYIDATEIREALRNKVDRSDNIIAYGPTNSLIITETAAKMKKLETLIEMLDREGYKTTTEVIPLKHAQADDVAKKLQTILESQIKDKQESKRNNIAGGEDIKSIIPDNRSNSLLVTATRNGIESILDLLTELDRPLSQENAMGRVHFRRLKHADAEELSGLLASMFGGASSSSPSSSGSSAPGSDLGGASNNKSTSASKKRSPISATISQGGVFDGEVRVGADPTTNALIITASPNDFASISRVIDELDSPRAQVFVEALIMEVKMSGDMNIGMHFSGAAGSGSTGLLGQSSFNPLGPGNSPMMLGQLDKSTLKNIAGAAGLALGAMSGGLFTLPGTSIQLPISSAVFKAAQKDGIFNVLSAPNILTTDNKKAEISIGQKVAVSTGSFSPTTGGTQQNVSREEIALKLAVTPQINDGDSVTLEIEQQIQDIDGLNQKLQSVNTSERSAKTTVIAQDKQTITLGGLIKDREIKTKNKVPLLGDIPLVGYLFRDTIVEKEKVNLILFLTPHIIREPQDLTRITVKKNNERRAFNKKHSIGENQALFDYDLNKGLDMAPQSKAHEEKKINKRFEYENEIIESEIEQSKGVQDEQLASPSQSVERRQRLTQQGSMKPDQAANPFAEIKPLSSN